MTVFQVLYRGFQSVYLHLIHFLNALDIGFLLPFRPADIQRQSQLYIQRVVVLGLECGGIGYVAIMLTATVVDVEVKVKTL